MMPRIAPRLTFAFACLAALAHGDAVLRLANGDRFHGQWDALSPDRLNWNSPAFAAPVSFQLDRVLDIQQPQAVRPLTAGGYEARIRLTNGDMLRGHLGTITKDHVQLETGNAGTLELCRPMIESVDIHPLAKLIYQGPSHANDWSQVGTDNSRKWTFKDGAYSTTAPAQLFREFQDLPLQYQFSFQLTWNERLRFRLSLCTEESQNDGNMRGAYMLYFESGRISLQKHNGRGNVQLMGAQVNVPSLQQNEKAQFDVYVDRAKGVVNLCVDGESVGLWQDPSPDDLSAKRGIRLFSLAYNKSLINVSHMRLYEWDGLVHAIPAPEPTGIEEGNSEDEDTSAHASDAPAATDRRLLLRNGDSLTGEVIDIANDIMRIKTPYREIELPVSRLRSVALPKVDYERAKLMRGDVRAHYPDGDTVTFRLDGIRDGKWLGFSQNFGHATFDPAAFKQIEFNIYESALESARKQE